MNTRWVSMLIVGTVAQIVPAQEQPKPDAPVPGSTQRYVDLELKGGAKGYGIVQPFEKTAKPKTARAAIYDEQADASVQIESALAKAKKENRRVLIQWGGNWCGWCHLLHDTFKKDRGVAKVLMYEYDVVLVDVGQFTKHMDLAAKYGATLKDSGVPFLTFLDAGGAVLGNFETGALEWPKNSGKEAGHDPEKVRALLEKHQAPAQKADDVFAAAVSKAKQDGKSVFLHFGAPWCGYCHKLEAWLARPEIAAIFAKDFVDCKIDVDRMEGGKPIFANYKEKSEQAGIPWFAIIDPAGVQQSNGGAIATSDGPEGNIGFPMQPAEVEHFKAMLEKARRSMTDDELRTLIASLAPAK
jgi:thiol-disulfide isomerase/thioredoxin